MTKVTPYIGNVAEHELLAMGCPKHLLHLYKKENDPRNQSKPPRTKLADKYKKKGGRV